MKKKDRVRMKGDIPLGPTDEGDMVDIPFSDIAGLVRL